MRDNGVYDIYEELAIQRENETIADIERLFKNDEFFDNTPLPKVVEKPKWRLVRCSKCYEWTYMEMNCCGDEYAKED